MGGDDVLIDEYILVPHRWRRSLDIARLVLAVACLLMEFLLAAPSNPLIRSLLLLFLVYSVLALYWKNLRKSSRVLLSLIIDFVFFLVSATMESEHGLWLWTAFYLFLMTRAVLLYDWKHVLVVAVISLGLFPMIHPADLERLAPSFLITGALALLCSRHRQLLVERLINSSRQAVLFRSESEKARQAERERIAADFHDGPQQSFISFQMRLEVLRKLLERDPDAARKELAQLQDLCKSQVAELRSFVRSMRPIEMDRAGLTASLSRLVESFQKDTGISTTFAGKAAAELREPEAAVELLQIVREALHNAQKHSGGSRIAVVLEKKDGAMEISIQDDGRGFGFAGTYSLDELDLLRLGPKSIKRRVRALGGELVVESRPGHGAGLKIRIPA